jgi:hypothetical protein
LKKGILILLALMLGMAMVACGGTPAAAPAAAAPAATEAAAGPEDMDWDSVAKIFVSDNPVVDGKVMIDYAYMDFSGWVGVFASKEDGTIGDLLGVAPLEGGTVAEGFTVDVDPAKVKEGDVLYVVLMDDLGMPGVFEPDVDTKVMMNGEPVMANLTVLPEPYVWEAPFVFVNEQVPDGSTIVADTVYSDFSSIIAIYSTVKDGTADKLVGYAFCAPGLNEYVPITIDLSVKTVDSTYLAVLLDDMGTIGVYEPDVDTPINWNGSGVQQSFQLR